jgi:hypothetical protein
MEERWQAIQSEAAHPVDFLLALDINLSDRFRGLARYVVDSITYRAVGGWKPLALRQQIESANIERQIGPARLRDCEEWLKENPMNEDPFECVGWYDA